MNLKVYVPKPESKINSHIAKGSGIVRCTGYYKPGTMKVYFEGNLYGAVNAHSIEQKLTIAAGRAITNYPTVDKMVVPEEEFDYVADFDFTSKKLTYVNDESKQILDNWQQ